MERYKARERWQRRGQRARWPWCCRCRRACVSYTQSESEEQKRKRATKAKAWRARVVERRWDSSTDGSLSSQARRVEGRRAGAREHAQVRRGKAGDSVEEEEEQAAPAEDKEDQEDSGRDGGRERGQGNDEGKAQNEKRVVRRQMGECKLRRGSKSRNRSEMSRGAK